MDDGGVALATGLPGAVVLRRLTTDDASAFARHVSGDLERLGRHLSWPARTTTPEDAAKWLRPYERREDGRVVVAGVWHDGALIGGALLFHHDPDQANVELGCWVVEAGEGLGVAAGACRALLARARVELRAERVEWHVSTENTASRRLAERLGFRHEGTLRSSYVLRDRRLDVDVLSLVGEELDTALLTPERTTSS